MPSSGRFPRNPVLKHMIASKRSYDHLSQPTHNNRKTRAGEGFGSNPAIKNTECVHTSLLGFRMFLTFLRSNRIPFVFAPYYLPLTQYVPVSLLSFRSRFSFSFLSESLLF